VKKDWKCLKAFNYAINTANRKNLKPKRNPDPRGVHWWNEECTAACALVYHAPSDETRHQAFHELRHTIKKAKRTWADNLLNSIDSVADMWRMAKVRKGRVNDIFPALQREDGSLAENPREKLNLLHARFFPMNPIKVSASQPDDPPPRAT
jgi:hypothetical protein